MQTYRASRAPRMRPGQKPEDWAREVADWLDNDAKNVEKAAQAQDDNKPLRYLDVAPSKPQDGLYLSAAGVLGVTRGLYRYDSSTETYTLIS